MVLDSPNTNPFLCTFRKLIRRKYQCTKN